MENLRGQRFTIDLSEDEADESASPSRMRQTVTPSISSAFIGDIVERTPAAPSAPKMKTTPTGFPEHKKRSKVSAFKKQRSEVPNTITAQSANTIVPSGQPQPADSSRPARNLSDINEEDRRRIDEENRQRLAAMSAEEINEERQELLASLDPSLIERLLKRANLDEDRGDTGLYPADGADGPGENSNLENTEDSEAVSAPTPSGRRILASKSVTWDDEAPADPINLQRASEPVIQPLPEIMQNSIHFPTAPAAPDLDPSDPSFLENLHTKYFPNLPADPSKLAWMAPLPTHGSVADQESSYYPSNETISASALRFDFRGGILPPRISRAMPSTKGLHHHGEAPEAAGYTVPELSRLARSAFPAQRCIAFQTLGRLLYRLGRGEWGDEDHDVTKGLWRCVEEGKIIETLQEAAGAEGGHQGSKTYAIEAVWLWQKGGGKVWKAS